MVLTDQAANRRDKGLEYLPPGAILVRRVPRFAAQAPMQAESIDDAQTWAAADSWVLGHSNLVNAHRRRGERFLRGQPVPTSDTRLSHSTGEDGESPPPMSGSDRLLDRWRYRRSEQQRWEIADDDPFQIEPVRQDQDSHARFPADQ